jgi:ribonuclease-3
MERQPTESFAALEERIGHRFKDHALLTEALTHSSAQGPRKAVRANERLEFLGDRVLGLLAAEALIARFPDAPEGDLAPRLNALVRKERCAAIASELGLGAHVRVAESEMRGGQPLKAAILADALEALIAAVYLDGGLDAARRFFVAAWSASLEEVDILPRDAKSALQEWTQDRALGLPRYELVSRVGPDHRPEFTVRVSVAETGSVEAKGASKRAGEQAAAAALLVRLAVWSQAEAERALAAGSA